MPILWNLLIVIGTMMPIAAVLLVICVTTIVISENTSTARNPPSPANGTSMSATSFAVPVWLRISPSAAPPANK